MELVSRARLEAFEDRYAQAVRTGNVEGLDVIGYGEVTVAVRLSTPEGDRVCKRLVPFSSAEAARFSTELIATYVERLQASGIAVVPTQTTVLERPQGHVLYCVQPLLRSETLGPEVVRRASRDEAIALVTRILERIRDAVSPTLAPDGQLSNWAFDGDRLLYLDVGTPFIRDERGRDQFDFTEQTRALPAPVRVIVDRFLLRGILDNYFSLRGQALDFLGNLVKEGLAELMPALVPVANRVFELEAPIDEDQVRRHYRSDAQTYAFIQAARRADRWVWTTLLRREYPYLLPPRIDRFG